MILLLLVIKNLKKKNKIITGIFNKPNLSIPYKLGKIKVTKNSLMRMEKKLKLMIKKHILFV